MNPQEPVRVRPCFLVFAKFHSGWQSNGSWWGEKALRICTLVPDPPMRVVIASTEMPSAVEE